LIRRGKIPDWQSAVKVAAVNEELAEMIGGRGKTASLQAHWHYHLHLCNDQTSSSLQRTFAERCGNPQETADGALSNRLR